MSIIFFSPAIPRSTLYGISLNSQFSPNGETGGERKTNAGAGCIQQIPLKEERKRKIFVQQELRRGRKRLDLAKSIVSFSFSGYSKKYGIPLNSPFSPNGETGGERNTNAGAVRFQQIPLKDERKKRRKKKKIRSTRSAPRKKEIGFGGPRDRRWVRETAKIY
ncbi:hypothetical protein CEXT_304271 [Caerostris extrusa]|uniref:Uncharacterized protein n=1 Tax=Caerostris extrusa TaxID=172846 RepID=A0AAV4SIF8_CAEEX|nr:hypothetical protein CEXT_304271 [Caerostris extrusa]